MVPFKGRLIISRYLASPSSSCQTVYGNGYTRYRDQYTKQSKVIFVGKIHKTPQADLCRYLSNSWQQVAVLQLHSILQSEGSSHTQVGLWGKKVINTFVDHDHRYLRCFWLLFLIVVPACITKAPVGLSRPIVLFSAIHYLRTDSPHLAQQAPLLMALVPPKTLAFAHMQNWGSLELIGICSS